MDRNMRHSSYSNSVGPRSLPHMMSNGGSKRHSGDVRHSGDMRHSGDSRQERHGDMMQRHGGDGRHSGDVRADMRDGRDARDGRDGRDGRDARGGHGGPGARLSPPNFPSEHNNNNHTNQHDDLIHYIYESWNKVTREVERGSEDAKYYQEVGPPRQLANFRPFNLEDLWARRLVHSIKRHQHRS